MAHKLFSPAIRQLLLLGLIAVCTPGLATVPHPYTLFVGNSNFSIGGSLLSVDLGTPLERGSFRTVAGPFKGGINDVICGPGGHLYFNEVYIGTTPLFSHRIWRANQDGAGREKLIESYSLDFRLSAMVFSSDDLYFGSDALSLYEMSQGIWRIPQATRTASDIHDVTQVLTPVALGHVPDDKRFSRPYAFLTAGAFAGDLLITDTSWSSNEPDGRVLRAVHPDFDEVVDFIPPYLDPTSGKPFWPSGLALTPDGDVLVTDASNGKVLKHGPDGVFKGVFAKIDGSNQIAVGSDGYVYLTTYNPEGRFGLFVFDPEGNEVASVFTNQTLALNGVALCPQ